MKEKRQVNRFKDVMWDYYLTNKQITKEFEDANRGQKAGKLNRREWSYIIVILVCLVLLGLKYFVF